MSELAERLLDAHVAHVLADLTGERFAELVRTEIRTGLAGAHAVTLDQVIGRDQVAAVAVKYVATFRLPGAIPELVGQIAEQVRTHPVNAVALGDLISRARVDELVTIVAEMRALRARLLRGLAESSALQVGVGDIVHGVATGAIASGRRLIGKVPLLAQGVDLATAVASPMTAPVTAVLDQRSRELAEHGAKVLLAYLGDSAAEGVSDEDLRSAVLEIWDAVAAQPVGAVLGSVSEDEFVGVFVGLYDLWAELRTTTYISTVVEVGVDAFFDVYGAFRLDELLEEFGLDADDLEEEALRFAPAFLDGLRQAGLLEAVVRRQLARFYDSAEARAILA